MRQQFCSKILQLIVLNGLFSVPLLANSKLPEGLTTERLKAVEKGSILSDSTVTDSVQGTQKTQRLEFYIAGLHERSCDIALRKLSQYEKYQEFLGFVERSKYDEQGGRIDFLLASPILPVKMILNFKIPRIQSPGVYPFAFDLGFLKGLAGNINVIEHQKRCLFYTTAQWQGPHSGYPNTVFEFFSNTLSKMAMERLFQISRI